MALTEHQQKLRAGRVTASRVPAILGVDPWTSPRQAFMEITGQAQSGPSEAAQIGSAFEEGVLSLFMARTGLKIKKRNVTRVGLDGLLLATLDAHTEDALVEAKTTGMCGRGALDDWGEDGTDEVPDRVIVQTGAQFLAAPEFKLAYVPAMLGGIGFRVYRITVDVELLGTIREGVQRFTRDHLDTGVAPAPDHRDLGVLEALPRRGDTIAQIPPALADEMRVIDAEWTKVDELYKATKARVLEAMGDTDCAMADGEVVATYRMTKGRVSLDAKALEAAEPDVFRKYTKVSPGYRRFLLKGG